MPSKVFDINLDLVNSDYQLVDMKGKEIVSGDTDSNKFNINLFQNFVPVNTTGNTAVIVFKKPDGTTVFQNLTVVDAAKGQYTCTLSSQTIVVPGTVKAEVSLYEGTKRLTSTRFEFIVRKAILDEDTVESSNEFSALTEALSNVQEYDGRITSVENTLDSHLDDGTQHAKTARFVVGTSTAGWTAKDCDYLCDGTADQVEINNAITALSASGGEIIILNGTYNITAKINVNKNNVSIRGNGNATILKRMWNSASAEGVITLTSVEGCRVQNLQIDGNKANYASISNYGVYLNSSSNNTITCNTCNNNGNGIYLNSSSNNIITGNTCNNNNNNGIRLNLSSNENTITGNTCNNNNTGIYLDSSSNENTITGNTYNNNNNYGIHLYSSSNNTITGNTCNNSVIGIRLNASDNNTVTGNTCIRGTGQTSDYTSDQYTILLIGSSNNYNLISSNNCMGKAVVVEGGTGNSAWGNKFDATNDLP